MATFCRNAGGMPTKAWRLRLPGTRDRPEAYPTSAVAAFCRNVDGMPTKAWRLRLPETRPKPGGFGYREPVTGRRPIPQLDGQTKWTRQIFPTSN